MAATIDDATQAAAADVAAFFTEIIRLRRVIDPNASTAIALEVAEESRRLPNRKSSVRLQIGGYSHETDSLPAALMTAMHHARSAVENERATLLRKLAALDAADKAPAKPMEVY